MKKGNFNSVTFVLYSITFLCVIFAGMLWKLLPKDIGTGMAIMFFGTLMHFLTLIYTMFIKQDIAASLIIGMFLAFWGINSCGLILSYDINPILKVIEPMMILFIIFVAKKSYRYQASAKNILLRGLVPLIALLWLSKIFGNVTTPLITTLGIITRIWIIIVGIWAFILMLMQLPEPTIPLEVIQDLLESLNYAKKQNDYETFAELYDEDRKLIKKLLPDEIKENMKISEIIKLIK
jgi:hypothetical protein